MFTHRNSRTIQRFTEQKENNIFPKKRHFGYNVLIIISRTKINFNIYYQNDFCNFAKYFQTLQTNMLGDKITHKISELQKELAKVLLFLIITTVTNAKSDDIIESPSDPHYRYYRLINTMNMREGWNIVVQSRVGIEKHPLGDVFVVTVLTNPLPSKTDWEVK